MKSAVFIERDGILNDVQVERGQQVPPRTIEEFHAIVAAAEPLWQLKRAGFILIAITNQPGIARGYQTRRDLDQMHHVLQHVFPLDDIMVCSHDANDHCPCRKPKPGLITEAAYKWKIDLDRSFVISDKWQDAEAARVSGCTSLLVRSPWIGPVHHDFIMPTLAAAVTKILQLHEHGCTVRQ